MFYINYLVSELRRRSGRTLLTALGLGIGIGLVVTVSALSAGLDNAQKEVLKPLTGVGTDISVSRPIGRDSDSSSSQSGQGGQQGGPQGGPPGGGPGGFGGLSESERKQLQKENGGGRLGLRNLGKAGSKFTRDDLVSTSQLSFPQSEVAKFASLNGAKGAAGSLKLNSIQASGTVPKQSSSNRMQGGPPGAGGGGPGSIKINSRTVTGFDATQPELAPVSPSQLQSGKYLSSNDSYEALVSTGYANREQLSVGDTVTIKEQKFKIVGVAKSPVGGDTSDVYVKLGQLQKLSDREGRVNQVRVRATNADAVSGLAKEIESTLPGAEVTTAEDLADSVSGSLVDAQKLVDDIGTVLSIIVLLAAFTIASLLAVSAVSKRTRELGTLKAIGWSKAKVVRQVAGETLAQGAIGGVIGIVLGLIATLIIGAMSPTLQASVEQAGAGSGGPMPMPGPFGQGAAQQASESLTLTPSIDPAILLLAVGLALLGGVLAGIAAGMRAARLKPAEALAHLG